MPSKWTPEKKREYARERYKRLKEATKKAKKKSGKPRQSKHRANKEIKPIHNDQPTNNSGLSTKETSSLPDSTKIGITGNPFVDTGLAVIASRSKLGSIDDLTLGDLRKLHRDGLELAKISESLKCFTMIFTTNSLLRQPSIKDQRRRIGMQAAISTEMLNAIGRETEDEYCQSCGNFGSADLALIANNALEKLGEETQDRFIGRDWFPMAGSLGSDAQALPSGSKSPSLCAKCLFAVQYLPLGVRLFGRDLAVFQSTSPKFWYGLVNDIERRIESQIGSGNNEILGSKQGRAGLAIQLLEYFKEIQEQKKEGNLEQDTKLYVWRFTNSTAPNLEIDEIPNHALIFLNEATRLGLGPEISRVMRQERTFEDRTFFSCIIAKRDYYGLYPGKIGKEKGFEGASPDLFFLYQTRILGKSVQSLKEAFEVAKLGLANHEEGHSSEHIIEKPKKGKVKESESSRSREIERLTRREAFREASIRSRYRKIMGEMARSGRFNLKMYLDIFPPLADDTISVSGQGWDLIRYYTSAIAHKKEFYFEDEILSQGINEARQSIDSPVVQLVRDSAQSIFNNYVEERGANRFELDVINRMERGKLGVQWLRTQFIKLARKQSGFNAVSWSKLCHPSDTRWTISELYFQYRLLWSEWMDNPQLNKIGDTITAESATIESIQNVVESSKIPSNIAGPLIEELDQYIVDRGLDRVEKDLLRSFQSGDLGLDWFASRLVRSAAPRVSEEEFDDFLHDSESKLQIPERTFQMSLFLSNAYRIRKNAPNAESLVIRVS